MSQIVEKQEVPADAFPTTHGEFRIRVFHDPDTGFDHVACTRRHDWTRSCLVRMHSECLTGDAFSSARCDCGPQLAVASNHSEVGWGCFLYLRQEGRGIGLHAKIQAYNLQDQGADTLDVTILATQDARDAKSRQICFVRLKFQMFVCSRITPTKSALCRNWESLFRSNAIGCRN